MESGILEGYNGKPDEPITARDAVLILYNALSAPVVEYTATGELQKLAGLLAKKCLVCRHTRYPLGNR